MDARIDKLKKQREQLEARIKKLEAEDKARERRRETRRKVLLGALLGEWMEKDDKLRAKVFSHLDRYLTRKVDREVFGLADPATPGGKKSAA